MKDSLKKITVILVRVDTNLKIHGEYTNIPIHHGFQEYNLQYFWAMAAKKTWS